MSGYSVNVSTFVEKKPWGPTYQHYCRIQLSCGFFQEAVMAVEDLKKRFPEEEGFKVTLSYETHTITHYDDEDVKVDENFLKKVIREKGNMYGLQLKCAERLTGMSFFNKNGQPEHDKFKKLVESL